MSDMGTFCQLDRPSPPIPGLCLRNFAPTNEMHRLAFAWATKQELETVRQGPPFTEKAALGSGLIFEEGHRLMDQFVFG